MNRKRKYSKKAKYLKKFCLSAKNQLLCIYMYIYLFIYIIKIYIFILEAIYILIMQNFNRIC